MTVSLATDASSRPSTATLEAIQRRVLWLATSIVHHANKVRETPSGVKVGGDQASSASRVSVMTAGRVLRELFARPGGDALEARIDAMGNEEYQRLLRAGDGGIARAAARRRALVAGCQTGDQRRRRCVSETGCARRRRRLRSRWSASAR
jgi:pyruvate dehydrogenase complex dehydrogenase (E1) component